MIFAASRRRTAGFSLIEVMVAIVVLTIGIFAIIRLFPGGFLSILRTSEMSQGQGLAQEQIDAEKQQPSVPGVSLRSTPLIPV